MKFQPFGYSFQVSSTQSPEAAKASLRAGMKGWFEIKNSPRGWIVGPVICLWVSAFNKQGPMLIGWILSENLGTQVRGRAGLDLNGVLMFTLLIPLMAFLLYQMITDGSASMRQLLVFAAVFLVGGPLVYWSAHEDRRQAEPLINFIEDALGNARPRATRRSRSNSDSSLPMQIFVCEDGQNGSKATVDAVCAAMEVIRYDPDGFVVLQQDDQSFMQAATKNDRFILEKREGSKDTHFAARRNDDGGDKFTLEEVTEALVDYLGGDANPTGVRWERLYR